MLYLNSQFILCCLSEDFPSTFSQKWQMYALGPSQSDAKDLRKAVSCMLKHVWVKLAAGIAELEDCIHSECKIRSSNCFHVDLYSYFSVASLLSLLAQLYPSVISLTGE